MSLILHIFQKDVRRLWPQLLVLIALFVSFDILEILSSPLQTPDTQRINSALRMLMLLLTLAIWYLIALMVYQEPLPGDRQFWLTRPYSRVGLLGAKVLFVIVFVNLPLFLSDCFILGAQGFPVGSSLPQLLLRQIPFSALFILPSFAIATVTRGVVQFVFAWFIILLSFIAQTLFLSALHSGQGTTSFSVELLLPNFLWVVTAVIIIWQYAKRHTLAGRAVLIALVFGGLPVMSAVFTLMQRFHPQTYVRSMVPANIHIIYDSNCTSRTVSPSPGYLLYLPIRVEGLPPDTLLQGTGEATITVEGKLWPEAGWHTGVSIKRSQKQYWLALNFPFPTLNALKSQPANLENSLRLTLVTDKVQTRIPVSETSFWVPHLGHCHISQPPDPMQLGCRMGISFQSRVRARG